MLIISKSSYIRGLQCIKSLYLNFFHKKYNIEQDELDIKKFDIGHNIGKLAQELFPGGKNCGYELTRNTKISCLMTKSLIKNNEKIIYEAAFQYKGLLCFADIMVRENNKWNIYEVKSSTEIKDYQINDVSFQYYVISKFTKINDIYIIYINNNYIREGKLELNKFFKIESVKDKVLDLQNIVAYKSEEFKMVTEQESIPEINIGNHCKVPFECDFIGYCWKDIPVYSVILDTKSFHKKIYTLCHEGIIKLNDVPKYYDLTYDITVEVKSFSNNKNSIDTYDINKFMKKINYPIYFMDLQSYQKAIPEFDNSRPYQQIPFQYSLYYKETKESKIKCINNYLDKSYNDPREELIKCLIKDTNNNGIILVYNAPFVKGILKMLSIDIPKYKNEINNILERLTDIMEPFTNNTNDDSSMQNYYYLKNVLPALYFDSNYENLKIQDRTSAGEEYLKLRELNDTNQIKEICENLIAYCSRNALGLGIILEELESVQD